MPAYIGIEEHVEAGLLDTIYRRRAVRSYKPTILAEKQVRLLLDAAVHAPTAMHREPWRFVIIQNRDVLRRLSDRAKELGRERAQHDGRLLKPHGAAGEGIASVFADPDFNIFYDAGTLIAICAEPDNEFAAADCWLAAENLMLTACGFDLGTCCIGFAVEVLNAPDVKTELGIPKELHVFAPIIVGVPKAEPDPVPRRSASVVNWIKQGSARGNDG